MASLKVNFHIYPFTMAKPYAVGLLLLILGIKLIYLVGSPISAFDLYFTLGFIASIAIIAVTGRPRLTLLSLVRVFMVVVVLLLPFVIGELFTMYLPHTYYHSFEELLIGGLSYLMVYEPLPALSISISILLLGISLIIYALASSWIVKIRFTDDGLVVEEGFLKPIRVLIPYSEIVNAEVSQSRLEELFDYGTLIIVRRTDSISVNGIEKPWLLKKQLTDRIQELARKESAVVLEDLAGTLDLKETCKICLKPLTNGSGSISLIKCPYCGIVYHEQCMSSWLKDTSVCPNCGVNLLNIIGIRRGE